MTDELSCWSACAVGLIKTLTADSSLHTENQVFAYPNSSWLREYILEFPIFSRCIFGRPGREKRRGCLLPLFSFLLQGQDRFNFIFAWRLVLVRRAWLNAWQRQKWADWWVYLLAGNLNDEIRVRNHSLTNINSKYSFFMRAAFMSNLKWPKNTTN